MASGKTPKIKRNGTKFEASWSPAKDYDDQEIQFYVKKDKNNANSWVKATTNPYALGKSTPSKTHTIDNIKSYYPGTNDARKTTELHAVGAKLRYKKDKKWSDWGSMGTFDIERPDPVTAVHCEQVSDEEYRYYWDPATSNNSTSTTKWRRYYYWETCIIGKTESLNWNLAQTQRIMRINSEEEPGSNKPSYQMYATTTSLTIRENQSDIAAGKVRHFRVQCLGTEGPSAWKTISRPLGGGEQYNPVQGEGDGDITYDGVHENGTSSGNIPLPTSNIMEGDMFQVQYAFVEPYVTVTTEGNTVRSKISLPNAFDSWQDYKTVKPTGQTGDSMPFTLSNHAADNQVLFVRTNVIRNNITTYGIPCMLEDGIGSLLKPTLSSFSASEPGQPQEITVTVTNNSPLGGGNGTFVAVYCRTSTNMNPDRPVGIIPYASGEVTKTFPASWGDGESVTVGVRAFVADYSPATPSPSGVTYYSISNIKMASSSDWDTRTTSTLPKAPTNVRVTKAAEDTTVTVEWDWTWTDANQAEISWSTNPNAWESNNTPSSYTVTGTRVGKRYITDLSADTYYFRVRLIRAENDVTSYGPYSEMVKKKISSAPEKPTLTLSKALPVVSVNEEITAFWAYESTDGTAQSNAMFAEVTQPTPGGEYVYTEIENARPNASKKYTFTPAQFYWVNGTTHMLAVRTRSGSGEWSEWSNAISITVAPAPVLTVSGIGGENDPLRPVVVDEDLTLSLALVKLPLTFTIQGMGAGGQASILINRASDYNRVDPIDDSAMAFEGETIYSKSFFNPDISSNSVTVTIEREDLLGKFDHFANYYLYISITDTYGQTIELNKPYEFTVYWDYFSTMPRVTTELTEDGVVLITPNATSTQPGDYCQIYRLSADKPQLVMDRAYFGETYVDQAPTYGRFGGYRIVYISKYGDWVTEDNIAAWTDTYVRFQKFMVTIEFGDNIVEFPGNISLNSSWQKDFQLTKYLGGAIEGDWNPGIERTGSINGTIPIEHESETIYLLRKLADYPGVCHVRTPEGSNFYANIEVQDDREERWVNRLSQISLSYTKVANRTRDLLLYSEWIEE